VLHPALPEDLQSSNMLEPQEPSGSTMPQGQKARGRSLAVAVCALCAAGARILSRIGSG